MPNWLTNMFSGFCGVLVTVGVTWYLVSAELENYRNIEMVKLSRELMVEFSREGSVYKKIDAAIDRCEPLYKSWGGEFDYLQLNDYLGFLEDLGYYEKQGLLELDRIGQFFGYNILEAYEKRELKDYIYQVRESNKQPRAFEDFEALARKLEELPDNSNYVAAIKHNRCFATRPKVSTRGGSN